MPRSAGWRKLDYKRWNIQRLISSANPAPGADGRLHDVISLAWNNEIRLEKDARSWAGETAQSGEARVSWGRDKERYRSTSSNLSPKGNQPRNLWLKPFSASTLCACPTKGGALRRAANRLPPRPPCPPRLAWWVLHYLPGIPQVRELCGLHTQLPLLIIWCLALFPRIWAGIAACSAWSRGSEFRYLLWLM